MHKQSIVRLDELVSRRINQLRRRLRVVTRLHAGLRTLIFLLNLTSFLLALYVLIISYDQLANITKSDFNNWTIVLATTLVVIFILNIVLKICGPLYRGQEYLRLINELKFLWLTYEHQQSYSLASLRSDIEQAKSIYLSPRQIRRAEIMQRLLGGE